MTFNVGDIVRHTSHHDEYRIVEVVKISYTGEVYIGLATHPGGKFVGLLPHEYYTLVSAPSSPTAWADKMRARRKS